MKIPIIFNLDEELIKKLKELDNRSLFLNELLHNHFNKVNPKNMSVEELEKLIAIEKIKEQSKTQIEALQNGA